MKIFKFLLFILSVSLTISCSKKDEEPVLPSGENTAYYYFNGGLIIPRGFLAGTTNIPPISYGGCAPATSQSINLYNRYEQLTIFLKNGIQNLGTYDFYFGGVNSDCNNQQNFLSLKIRSTTPGLDMLYTSTQNSGEINITKLSADKRKFSGTFKATLKDANGQTVEITGGVFDINLDTL